MVTPFNSAAPPLSAEDVDSTLPEPGTTPLAGDAQAQIALSLGALLPWLTLHVADSMHAPLVAACIQVLHSTHITSKRRMFRRT